MIRLDGWRRDVLIGTCVGIILAFFACEAADAHGRMSAKSCREAKQISRAITALAHEAHKRDVVADIMIVPRHRYERNHETHTFNVQAGFHTRDGRGTFGTARGVDGRTPVEELIDAIRDTIEHARRVNWPR